MRIRAVIVDDDSQIREAFKLVFESRGYEVFTYSEPVICPLYLDSTCECPQEHACADILLSDIDMPRVTGLEFIANQQKNGCKGLSKNKALMSGTWTEEQLADAEKLGCQVFHKPVSLDELNRWLDECEQRINPARKLAEIL